MLDSLLFLGETKANARRSGSRISDKEWAEEFDLVGEAVSLLSHRILQFEDQLTPFNITSIVMGVYRLEQTLSPKLLEALTRQSLATMDSFRTVDTVNLPFYLSQLKLRPSVKLLDALVAQAASSMSNFKAIDVTRLLVSLATLEFDPANEEFFDRVLVRLHGCIGDLKNSEVASVFWALGSLRKTLPRDVAVELSSAAALSVGAFNSFQVSGIMRAHAKWQIPPEKGLLCALLEHTASIIHTFAARELSVFLHASAVLQLKLPDGLVDKVKDRCAEVVEDFSSQGVSITMWAFAKLGVAVDKELFGALADQVGSQPRVHALWAGLIRYHDHYRPHDRHAP